MNRHLILLIGLFLGITTALNGQVIQSKKRWVEAADAALALKDYYAAFKFYDAALEYDTSDIGIWYKYAECARNFNADKSAIKGYLEVLKKDTIPPQFPLARFWLAYVRERTGDYGNAKTDYEAYLLHPSPDPKDKNTEIFARKGIEECSVCIDEEELTARSAYVPLRPISLGSNINGKYSDFGAIMREDTLYYTSFIDAPKQRKTKAGQMMLRVFRSINGNPGQPLSDQFNIPGKHIAYSALTPDNSGVYYTVCEYINASDLSCDLYYRDRLGEDTWGTPLRLSINPPDSVMSQKPRKTLTQPAVGVDAGGQRLLFFVSNELSEQENYDIWVGQIEGNGDVLRAEKLDHINTMGKEISPAFHDLSQQLYFSTDGQIGRGGLDVFKVQRKSDGSWGEIKPAGVAVNTSFDDVYFSLNTLGDKGVLSSNQPESTAIDSTEEGAIVCCYDIYEIPINLSVAVQVATRLSTDSSALYKSTVEVYELSTDGERLVESLVIPDQYVFELNLQRNKKYRVVAKQEDYSTAMQWIDLTDLDDKTPSLSFDLYQVKEKLNLEVLTFDAADHTALIGTRVQLSEVVDGDTLLLGDLTNAQSNNFDFIIQVNREYLISARKPDYDSLITPLIVSTEDLNRLGKQITVELELPRIDFTLNTQNRIALYFENGSPDGRSWSKTTKTEYAALNKSYYAQKQVYIDRFTAGMDPTNKFLITERYESFFEREVRTGLENLQKLADELLHYLGAGHSIEIELKGYASPRASDTFNEVISQRRIVCIGNFFREYKNGQFLPFLNNGQFKITEKVFGESTAKGDVPDRLDDEKGSIYGYQAALERRVEIVKVRTQIAKQQ